MNLMLTDHSQPALSHLPNARLPPLISTNLFLMLVSLHFVLGPGEFLTKAICVTMGLEPSGRSSGHTTKRNGSLSHRIYR